MGTKWPVLDSEGRWWCTGMEAECSESFLCPGFTTMVSLGMLGAEGRCEYKQRK